MLKTFLTCEENSLEEKIKYLSESYGMHLEGNSEPVTNLVISNDHSIIIGGSRDNTIRIWNGNTRKQEAILKGHESSIYSLIMSNDNKYAISGSGDRSVRV